MPKKEKKKREKQIVFSEKIDSSINGYAIGISFTSIGVFLLLKPDYFSVPIVSYIIGSIIGIFGMLGTGAELSKHSKVKGLGNLTFGIVFLAAWSLGYVLVNSLLLNILFFVFLILGCYALCLGLIQSIVSIIMNVEENRKKQNENKRKIIGENVTQIILFLTQLCGLLLAIINVLRAII